MDGLGGEPLARAVETIRPRLACDLTIRPPDREARPERRKDLADLALRADLILVSHVFDDREAEDLASLVTGAARPDASILAFHSAGALMRAVRVGRFRMGGARPRERRGKSALASLLGKIGRGLGLARHYRTLMAHAPRILSVLPGRAGDMATFIESYLAWLEASVENLGDLILRVAHRHHGRLDLAGTYSRPRVYPATGAWHPLTGIMKNARALEAALLAKGHAPLTAGRIGLVVQRNPILGGESAHLAAIVAAYERSGLLVLPVFGSIFDYRPVLADLGHARVDRQSGSALWSHEATETSGESIRSWRSVRYSSLRACRSGSTGSKTDDSARSSHCTDPCGDCCRIARSLVATAWGFRRSSRKQASPGRQRGRPGSGPAVALPLRVCADGTWRESDTRIRIEENSSWRLGGTRNSARD